MYAQVKQIPAWLVANHQVKEYAMPDEDIELMMDLARGNDGAMRLIIERWQRPLINFFYRSLGNQAEAEDLAQRTFIKLYRAAPRYKPSAKFSTYLFHIARGLLINEYRRQSRKPLDTYAPEELHAHTDNAQQQSRQTEIEEAFERAIAALPEKQRTAILLLKQQELSYDEIAKIMKARTSSVKTWIHRARQHLRQELEEFHEGT